MRHRRRPSRRRPRWWAPRPRRPHQAMPPRREVTRVTDVAAVPGGVATDHGHSHATNTGMSNEKVAMWAFLGSECLLFGALISTYLLYRGKSVSGPTPHQIYDIPYTSASSFVLLMSSLTMVLALAAIQRGDGRRLRVWLLATALLGATFISGQVYEFTSFIREGLTIKTNLF